MCAGYGTRLYPLTKEFPKALLEVAGKPILDHIVQRLNEVEPVDQVIIVTNAKFYEQFSGWARQAKTSKSVVVLNDGTLSNEDRLGALGDLRLAIERYNIMEDLLVIGGDNLFSFSLGGLQGFFEKRKTSVIALHDLKEKSRVAKKYGVALLNSQQKIIDFQEKPELPKSTFASTLCYALTGDDVRKVRQYLDKSGKFDNAGDLIVWLSQQQPGVHGFVFEDYWCDIGSHETLGEARQKFGGFP